MGKTCSLCGKIKLMPDFHKCKITPDGLDYRCKECAKQRAADYYKANADHIRQHVVNRNQAIRVEVLRAYGGATCAHCGETRLSCLTLDHIEQNGAEKRREGEKVGAVLHAELKRLKFPSGFRVLCSNCNWKAWLKHQQQNQSKSKSACRAREYRARQKQTTFGKYGGSVCVLCGETDIDVLSLDHINGKGNKHRASLRKAGYRGNALYCWIQKNNYPPGFRILCLNCNCSRENDSVNVL
jgi:hypothetical protein